MTFAYLITASINLYFGYGKPVGPKLKPNVIIQLDLQTYRKRIE